PAMAASTRIPASSGTTRARRGTLHRRVRSVWYTRVTIRRLMEIRLGTPRAAAPSTCANSCVSPDAAASTTPSSMVSSGTWLTMRSVYRGRQGRYGDHRRESRHRHRGTSAAGGAGAAVSGDSGSRPAAVSTARNPATSTGPAHLPFGPCGALVDGQAGLQPPHHLAADA